MKAIVISAFLLLCCHETIYGQTNKFDIGIEACPNLAEIKAKGHPFDELLEVKAGFSAGLNAQYKFSKLLSIKTGISYERAGYKIVDILTTTSPSDTISFEYNFRIHLDYLKIPVLANIRFGHKVQYFYKRRSLFWLARKTN